MTVLAATARFEDAEIARDFALAEIVAVDALGYACIREDQIDIAFHASGKGVRLPRTCLPEPCRAALTQFELASLIGRPAFPEEWDDYVSRYADHCRKEIVPFEEADASDEPQDEAVAFWAPLAATYPATAPIHAAFPSGPGAPRMVGGSFPTPGGLPPARFDPDFDPERKTIRVEEAPRPGRETEDQPPPVSPVPLPGGLVLVLTALLCLFLPRRAR